MAISLFLIALALLGGGATLSLLTARRPGLSACIAAAAAVLAAASGVTGAVNVLATGEDVAFTAAWSVPFGSFYLGIDALSAVFLLVIFIMPAIAAVYGVGYMRGANTRQAAVAWPMFLILTGAMALLVCARNGVLFLMAWEAMAISSFFLVTLLDRAVAVRNAGRIYLIASHIGTAFLLAFFLLAPAGGSMDFDAIDGTTMTVAKASALFILALVGFGTKAGLMPAHVWLPEAHPAAPGFVSAVMSAVMIKTGIYGLLRAVSLLGPPEAWWGWTVIGVGVVSALLGALAAFTQKDIKRLLAYSTIENAGLIAIGIGIGMVGEAYRTPWLAVLGYGGALLHVLNHAVFKGLLFLGAGAVDHAAGTRDIERLGGLMKKMPWTGAVFLVGALAASGMPPFSGFVSEFLLFRGGIDGGTGSVAVDGVLAAVAAIGIGATGALAAGAMLKVAGITFLGAPRSEPAAHAHEASISMVLPMVLLAAGVFLMAFFSRVTLGPVSQAGAAVLGADPHDFEIVLRAVTGSMDGVVFIFAVLVSAASVLAAARLWLLSGRRVAQAVTWDCGYVSPTTRMQYTGSSFAEPVTTLLAPALRITASIVRPSGLFPNRAGFETSASDLSREAVYRPVARAIDRSLVRLRWLQHGRLNVYILYIVVTLMVLLVWRVGFA